jgi:hypothetical protein
MHYETKAAYKQAARARRKANAIARPYAYGCAPPAAPYPSGRLREQNLTDRASLAAELVVDAHLVAPLQRLWPEDEAIKL